MVSPGQHVIALAGCERIADRQIESALGRAEEFGGALGPYVGIGFASEKHDTTIVLLDAVLVSALGASSGPPVEA